MSEDNSRRPAMPGDAIRGLASRNPERRSQAAWTMSSQAWAGDVCEEDIPQRLVVLYEQEWKAIRAGRSRLVSSLATLMADRTTALSDANHIAYALAAAGEDGVTELVQLLGHHDFSVHTYAAEGIGALGNRARWAVPALCAGLARSRTPWSTTTILRALGRIGGARAVRELQAVAAKARAAAVPDDLLLTAVEGALANAVIEAWIPDAGTAEGRADEEGGPSEWR